MSIPSNQELARIAAAVEFVSPTALRFAGRPFQQPPAQGPRPQSGGPPPVVSLLQNTLYQYCYVRPFAGAAVDPPYAPRADDDLTPVLSRANAGAERWEAGWTIEQILASGQILARRFTTRRFLWPGEFVSRDGPGIQPRAGQQVSVFVPRESATMQPGFYFVFSETAPDQGDELDLVRFYWNLSDDGSPVLVHRLTTALNRFGVPFRFKALTSRAAYVRSDCAVLYVSRRYYNLSAELVAGEVQPHLAAFTRPETPLFAKPLAAGLALAEDPQSGESFGMSRCRLMAEALWQAHAKGVTKPDDRIRAVAEHFRASGFHLERPYLNPGSQDRYDFPALAAAA